MSRPDNNMNKNYLAVLFSALLIELGLVNATFAQTKPFFPVELLEMNELGQESIDLSLYETEGAQIPGPYRVDIMVNAQFVQTETIHFYAALNPANESALQPCLSVSQLTQLHIKTAPFPDLKTTSECVNLAAIPQASAIFDFENQRLLLSIPHAALDSEMRGFVPETQWDEGIPSVLLNYSYNGSYTQERTHNKASEDSHYVNLRSGINLGPWRLRNYSTWMNSTEGEDKWNTIQTYLQRGINPLKSQLTIGDGNSNADIFDMVPFRGIQLASDEEMLPDNQRGYAPAVRGIARTNAQITIKQNGYVIYQTYVAPGPFDIADMYPTGGSGDLEVTVKESDGTQQQFVVPFASLPVLQRNGQLKYSATIGQYRAYHDDVEKSYFGQVTAIYGLPAEMSVYGGTQLAEQSRYQSLSFGIGKNLGNVGAISVDMTQSWAALNNVAQTKDSGQSWRLRYSKNLLSTGTNIAIAGYRYSTAGFYTLNEVLNAYHTYESHNHPVQRRRNRAELVINQQLSENRGNINLHAITEDYWKSQRRTQSFGLGYSNSWRGVSYGLNYNYYRNRYAGDERYQNDQVFSLNFSIPLNPGTSDIWANYNMLASKGGQVTNSVGLNGTALKDGNLYWNVNQSYTSKGGGANGNIGLDYRGSYSEANLAYSYDKHQQRLNYGIQGSLLVHENGVTFGRLVYDSAILVKVPDAAGVRIMEESGITTDFRGYALIPHANPYRKNQINLDTENLPDTIDFTYASETVVPTRGAVARANFKANIGSRALISLTQASGLAVPFGATVSVSAEGEERQAIVGDHGQVYLSGLKEKGVIQTRWGLREAQQCTANYQLSKQKPASGVYLVDVNCL